MDLEQAEEIWGQGSINRMQVVEDSKAFKLFWDAQITQGANQHYFSASDPPTSWIERDGRILAKVFADFGESHPAQYLVEPQAWELWQQEDSCPLLE